MLTEVIVLTPLKMDRIGCEPKKSSYFFRVESTTVNTQKLKFGIPKVKMGGLLISRNLEGKRMGIVANSLVLT